jgi:hypothetical protein
MKQARSLIWWKLLSRLEFKNDFNCTFETKTLDTNTLQLRKISNKTCKTQAIFFSTKAFWTVAVFIHTDIYLHIHVHTKNYYWYWCYLLFTIYKVCKNDKVSWSKLPNDTGLALDIPPESEDSVSLYIFMS